MKIEVDEIVYVRNSSARAVLETASSGDALSRNISTNVSGGGQYLTICSVLIGYWHDVTLSHFLTDWVSNFVSEIALNEGEGPERIALNEGEGPERII